MRLDRTVDVARRKAGLGPDHNWIEVRVIGNTRDIMVTLAKPTGVYKSGERKGEPKYTKAVEHQAVVTVAETDAEVTAYETRTGLCSDCDGSKRTAAGWSAGTGTRYETCARCKGDGKSHLTGAPEPVPAAPPAGPVQLALVG